MRSRERELSFLYLFFDLIILNLTIIVLAYKSPTVSLHDFSEMGMYIAQGNLSLMLTYLFFARMNLYAHHGLTTRIERVIKRTAFFGLIALAMSFMFISHHYSHQFLMEYTLLFFAAEVLFYLMLYKYMKYQRKKNLNTSHTLVVGINQTAHYLRKIIDCNYMMSYKFMGFVDETNSEHPEYLGHPDNLQKLILQHHIEMVFVTMSVFATENRLMEYLKICNHLGVRLNFVPEIINVDKTDDRLSKRKELVLINPQEIPLDKLEARLGKRIFDVLFSTAIILLLFSWLIPIIAILIKLTSKGPVFFVQKRTGINNEIFNCIKFRSMEVNFGADKIQCLVNDSRITPIGRFMRKTNIDELPQFFNVLMGQMSVVGPRPHMLIHTEEFSGLVKYYLTRHYVKPGITGWAQISGFRGITDERWKLIKRVEYDMEYIQNWSMALDLKIIGLTIIDPKSYYNAG